MNPEHIQITRVQPQKIIQYCRPATETTPFEICSTPFHVAARQNLYLAMRRLIPRACDECFLDKKEWCNNAMIDWVQILHGEADKYGFSIRMSLQREAAKPVSVIMPPLTPELTDADSQTAIKALIQEAKHYLEGQREVTEQVELFVKDEIIASEVTTSQVGDWDEN